MVTLVFSFNFHFLAKSICKDESVRHEKNLFNFKIVKNIFFIFLHLKVFSTCHVSRLKKDLPVKYGLAIIVVYYAIL